MSVLIYKNNKCKVVKKVPRYAVKTGMITENNIKNFGCVGVQIGMDIYTMNNPEPEVK